MNAATRGLWHAVYDRSEGQCDCCGRTVGFEGPWAPHHRKTRAQGGADELPNLLMLCVDCHLPRVHLQARWAYAHGFLVPNGTDPARYAVERPGGWYMPGWYMPGDIWELLPPGASCPPMPVPLEAS